MVIGDVYDRVEATLRKKNNDVMTTVETYDADYSINSGLAINAIHTDSDGYFKGSFQAGLLTKGQPPAHGVRHATVLRRGLIRRWEYFAIRNGGTLSPISTCAFCDS